ncbi:MAG: hypothetical protein AAFY72_11790 [Cyanobacteria bacterium J06649_4]
MTSFDLSDTPVPHHLVPQSPNALGMQDLNGLLRVHLNQRIQQLSDLCFTEIDQAFLIWGSLTLAIFSLAQFSHLSWTTQAVADAALTGIGIASTSGLTWKLASDEKLRWVIFLWAALMTAGIVVTACGIFGGVGTILLNLCPIWLALCALGYGAMAVGMRSHAFTAASLVHSVTILGLHHQPGWQFLTSGLVMALTLVFFSVVPWDMQASEVEGQC